MIDFYKLTKKFEFRPNKINMYKVKIDISKSRYKKKL